VSGRPARLVALLALGVAAAPRSARADTTEAALTAERDAAIEQVMRIVNAPVEALPRPPGVLVNVFRPGWFHEGAVRPAFASVDVRATQQFPYDAYEYVTSDLNPGVMFRGRDLEFNAMTKFFYADRSLPKKRLGPEEMAEINRLYRVIAAREQDLVRLRAGSAPAPSRAAAPPVERVSISRTSMPLYVAGAALLLLVVLLASRRSASGP